MKSQMSYWFKKDDPVHKICSKKNPANQNFALSRALENAIWRKWLLTLMSQILIVPLRSNIHDCPSGRVFLLLMREQQESFSHSGKLLVVVND